MTTTRRILFLAFFLISGIALTVSQASLAVRTGTQLPPADAGGTDRAISRRAPSINGRLEGSIQQLTPENVTLNGGATITAKLYVPGTPTVRRNGNPNNPLWLTLHVSNGGVTLNGGSQMFGKVNAPSGSATVNSRLTGNVICDRLTVNRGGIVTILAQAPQDTTAPSITIAEPIQGLITKNSPITVSGTVTDTNAVTVTVNGQPVTLSGAQFSASVILTEGSNTITVLATDAFGNVGTASRNITHDSIAPILTISEPQSSSITSGVAVYVKGSFEDANQVTISVNHIPAIISGNNFSVIVPLQEGDNTLTCVIIDKANNQTTHILEIERDTTPPGIEVISPSNDSVIVAEQVTVEGSVTDPNGATVFVNGNSVQVNGTHFQTTVSLEPGTNKILVRAEDTLENANEVESFVIHPKFFSLNLEKPIEGTTVNSSVVGIAGEVSGTDVAVLANGVRVPVPPNNKFYGSVPVTEGTNQITIRAIDITGAILEEVRTIQVDQTAPSLTNLTPITGSWIQGTTVNIKGRVSDSLPVTVSIGEISVEISPDEGGSEFELRDIPIQPGFNTLEVRAEDIVGNTQIEDLLIYGKRQTIPQAPVLFPVNSPTRLEFQVIEGRAESESKITITGGVSEVSTVAAPGSGLFIATVNLREGGNQLSIIATDIEGNLSPRTTLFVESLAGLPTPPAGQPFQINTTSGDAQVGLIDTELPRPLVTIITDVLGNPVENIEVEFLVVHGNGKFSNGNKSLKSVTNSQGQAIARYITGPEPGIQVVYANFSGNTNTRVIFMCQVKMKSLNGGLTRVSGIVLDQNLCALPNVIITVTGRQNVKFKE